MGKDSKKTHIADIQEMVIPFSESKVDKDSSIIRNVCFLSRDSKNPDGSIRRSYMDKALNDFVQLAEGCQVYHNHPLTSELRERQGVRDHRDIIGRGVNLRRQGEKVFGDLEVLKVPGVQERIFAYAEQMPQIVGFSPRVQGRVFKSGGKEIVESIPAVRSTDLVSEPATTKSLFEQSGEGEKNNSEVKDMEWKELYEAEQKKLTVLEAEDGKIKTELQEAKDEIKSLKEKIEAFEAQAGKDRVVSIKAMVESVGLPKEVLTDSYRKTIEGAKTIEEAKQALDVLSSAFKAGGGKVKNSGFAKDDGNDGGAGDKRFKEIGEAIFAD